MMTELRATQIHALTDDEKTGLPTNNLIPERDFSVFDCLAKSAKSMNQNFEAINIRNDMTLLHTSVTLTKMGKQS